MPKLAEAFHLDDPAATLQRIADRSIVRDCGYTSPCWVSTRATSYTGYTKMRAAGKVRNTHRVAYVAAHGPIPLDLVIDHLCRVRACCNPDHLEAVTTRVNLLRGETRTASEAAQTECKRGHPLVGHNVYRRADYPNKRECRACRNTARHRRPLDSGCLAS